MACAEEGEGVLREIESYVGRLPEGMLLYGRQMGSCIGVFCLEEWSTICVLQFRDEGIYADGVRGQALLGRGNRGGLLLLPPYIED